MSSHHDEICNDAPNEHFQQVLARGTRTPLTRRNLVRGGVGLAALSTLPFWPPVAVAIIQRPWQAPRPRKR